jgi:hypothetical protein
MLAFPLGLNLPGKKEKAKNFFAENRTGNTRCAQIFSNAPDNEKDDEDSHDSRDCSLEQHKETIVIMIPTIGKREFFSKVYPARIAFGLLFAPFPVIAWLIGLWPLAVFLVIPAAGFFLFAMGTGDGIQYRNPFDANIIKVGGKLKEYRRFLNGDTYHYNWFTLSTEELNHRLESTSLNRGVEEIPFLRISGHK